MMAKIGSKDTWQLKRRSHTSTTLLNGGVEVTLQPGLLLDKVGGPLAAYLGVGDIRVLSSRVVSPDDESVNVRHLAAKLVGELSETSVVILK